LAAVYIPDIEIKFYKWYDIKIGGTAVRHLTGLYALRRPAGGSGSKKPQSGLRPFVRFFSATFGAGVNAPHCPITRPKRRIQPVRYAK
jgi:hypothetical protein